MKRINQNLQIFVFVTLCVSFFHACVHEPILPTDPTITDTTTNPIDTITLPPDTTSVVPCDPDTVYFERDILPLLISNCAKSGCHDAISHQDGVNLTSYENVIRTTKIDLSDIKDSEIYEVLVEDDRDKRMPPPPASRLDNAQINLIEKWLSQGAQNLSCGDTIGMSSCDTTSVSYSQTVEPILKTHCVGCHQGASPSGGIGLDTHAGVAATANSGKLYGAISHSTGFTPMPQGTNQLPDCEILQIKAWIDAGAGNN